MDESATDESLSASILWRRLSAPGHDACRLERSGSGWILRGTAVFQEEGSPACVAYRLDCDESWRTRKGEVRGWFRGQSLDFVIEQRQPGVWTLNGEAVPGLEDCADLDLGFTPATNLAQLRRIALEVGQTADVPVAWLDNTTGSLTTMFQRYERRSSTTYWYEAPAFDYGALLEVDANGFVTHYPELWQAET